MQFRGRETEEGKGIANGYTAYVGHGSDFQELKRANVEILENAVLAVDALCPKLRFWTLQTGGKVRSSLYPTLRSIHLYYLEILGLTPHLNIQAYGVEFTQYIPYNPPLSESAPRIPEPYASNVFYYAQYDLLSRLSENKSWSFTEIRPDAIIGFVPNHNAMNLAQCLALFFSFYKWKEGQGAEIAFPGSKKAWTARHTDTHQDILAKFHIWSALRPEQVKGKAFNIADGQVISWADIWPGISSWFDLKGVGPTASSQEQGGSYVSAHQSLWPEFEKSTGLREGTMAATGWPFMDAILKHLDFDRQFELSRSREVEFEEKIDTIKGYILCFERMRRGGVIP